MRRVVLCDEANVVEDVVTWVIDSGTCNQFPCLEDSKARLVMRDRLLTFHAYEWLLGYSFKDRIQFYTLINMKLLFEVLS